MNIDSVVRWLDEAFRWAQLALSELGPYLAAAASLLALALMAWILVRGALAFMTGLIESLRE